MKSDHLKYRPDIDGLRAIAVVAVLFFHAFPRSFPGGFAGVDIFFVISGFLITSIILKSISSRTFSLKDFYSRRVRRIFPSLLLVLFSSYFFGWFFLIPEDFANLGKHIKAGALFISNFELWNDAGYFDTSAERKPLLHLWSLAIEEQFYILWPLLLIFFSKKRVVTLGLVACLLLSFAANIYYTNTDLTAAFYSPASRFWEILLGAALAIYGSEASPKMRAPCATLGIGFIALSFYFLDKSKSFPGFWALLPTVGACLIIFAGSQSWINKKILSHSWMIGIGLISYPLYLWHWPIFSGLNSTMSDIPTPSKLAALLISLILAILTYKLIEGPLKGQNQSRLKIIVYSTCMIFIGGLGFYTLANGGMVGRYPDNIRPLAEKIPFSNWEKGARTHECHIQNPATDSYHPHCIEKQRPLIFLWGDSHAAALYPGLKAQQAKHVFGIAQLTHVGNPPYLDDPLAAPIYRENNYKVFEILKNAAPEIVILHAAYFESGRTFEEVIQHLNYTIKKVKMTLPKTKIVVIGPVPTWKGSLQKNAITYYMSSSPKVIPEYMSLGLNRKVLEMDAEMESRISLENVSYLSATKALCNDSKCLVYLKMPNKLELTTIDYGHLSHNASKILVERLFSKIYK